jgi:hypothetical protein
VDGKAVQTLTEEITRLGLTNHVVSDSQLARILSGSPQRRHHLVNRALKAGELIRVRRGLYVLEARLRDHGVHPFALAQALVPGSYVSFETALAHHGWIPEAVRAVACVTPGRKSAAFEVPAFGSFSFSPLAIEDGGFLELVAREASESQHMLVAKPVRALMDLACLRKWEWQGLAWLTEGLRIESDLLRAITGADIGTLEEVYKHRRMKSFLRELARKLGHD